MAQTQICLDLGEKTLKIADATLSNNQIEIHSLGSQDDVPNIFEAENKKAMEELIKLIGDLNIKLKLKERNVNIVIPDGFTYSQIIEMPRLKEKELLSAIRYQADQFIPMPLDETALDLDILFEDPVNKKLLVLIEAAPQKLIARITQVVESAGFIPESIENELSAVARLATQFFSGKAVDSGMIFLNFGYTSSSLYFFNKKRNLIEDVHNFKNGFNLFLKETQVNTNSDSKKSLEILKTIGFSSNASLNLGTILTPVLADFLREIEKFTLLVKEKHKLMKIDNIYIFNFGHLIKEFDRKIEASFSIPTSNLDLSAVIKKNDIYNALSHELPAFITTLAGALR